MTMLSTIVLAAGVVVLLLLIALGLVAIVMSDQAERRTVLAVVVIGGLSLLLLLLCCGTVAGLAWYFTTQAPALAPIPPPARPVPRPLVPPASISLVPDGATVAQGESISVTIYITDATGLYGVQVHLTHDDGLSAGGLVPGTCASDFVAPPRTAEGQIEFAAARVSPHPPLSGDCDAATFTVTGEAPGTHVIAFDDAILADSNGNALPVLTRDGSITVTSPAP